MWLNFKSAEMNGAFTSISIDDYVELHLRSNPGEEREELTRRLTSAAEAKRRGDRCHCGASIWIVGSAQAGLACFTCITGELAPDDDYEVDLSRS